MPPKCRERTLFELGRYRIKSVAGSKKLYRFWYDPRIGDVRRRSLKTEDLEEAKIALAEIFLREGDGQAREPRDVSLVAVLTRYFEQHSDHRPNPSAARRSGDLLFQFLGDSSAKVSVLSKLRQREFMRWLHERGLSVAYISRVQSIIAAALRRSVADDDDEEGYLLSRAPRIIYRAAEIAEILDAPEPEPRTWHPSIDMLARFLDCLPGEEETRLLRFTILTLVFGRPEAVKELQPFQIDDRDRLVSLNRPGRRQTKKYRPQLPIPGVLWPALASWRDADHIVHNKGKRVSVLRKPWHLYRNLADLPASFVPKSLRHMLATELRKRDVPREQREIWQGHRRISTNDRYGIFSPDFLKEAQSAVNDLLMELDEVSRQGIFRQVSVTAEMRNAIRVVRNS